MKKQPKVYEIPDVWYDVAGRKMQTQLRGKRCYTLRSLDEFRYQYRVMAKLVRTCPAGLTETLIDNQEYQRFRTMQECEAHFHKVERNGIDIMLPGTGK